MRPKTILQARPVTPRVHRQPAGACVFHTKGRIMALYGLRRGSRVVAADGEEDSRHPAARGTVTGTDTRAGTVVVQWDSGRECEVDAEELVREGGW